MYMQDSGMISGCVLSAITNVIPLVQWYVHVIIGYYYNLVKTKHTQLAQMSPSQ